ncbi:MAG TPA: hypothetical protein DIW80_09735 [Gordonia polyisoprenivorans]|uniref:hypothetical protein n=1 Tax=Gordonia polyisoprenivorans TaxID=84595 RepID=UPI000EC280DA|nr:hypothetical protein LH935_27085 [Gordonia polyisoprenivorans]HCS57466.1 hypothetical protein [Gordonia polyisoprenivorans]
MENPIIAALGALGAWLLVAGPLYQAATELRDQGLTQRRALPDTIAPSQPISPWWWLIPPVAYWRHHRERTRIKREVIGVMSTEEVQRMLAFSNTALGWLLVAAGATCIAIKETWEFVHMADWPPVMTWVIIVLAAAVAVGNAAMQTARTSHILAAAEDSRDD